MGGGAKRWGGGAKRWGGELRRGGGWGETRDKRAMGG